MKPRATKDDTMSQKKVREMSDAVVNVWDVKAQGWRSFRYDRINSVDIVDEYMMGWYNEDTFANKSVDSN
jgi:predicted DNA-binding transcriptional regulator YafY